jgi:hypothetical protein
MKRIGIAFSLLLAGCATHHQPPAPNFPPVAENEVRIMAGTPSRFETKVGTVTVEQEFSVPIEQSYATARKLGGDMGADVLYVKQPVEYAFINGALKPMRAHIISFTAIRSERSQR